MMAGQANHSMLLFDIPPAQIETFCKIMDSGIGTLGWKGLAARILPTWQDVRCTEMREAAGKSPTQELLWSWAQQNKTVGDLLRVLEEMGHWRALSLFQSTGHNPSNLPKPPPPSLEVHKPKTLNCHTESLSSESISVAIITAGNGARVKVSFADILEGTGNFHQDRRIGGGTFSDVYRGIKGSETFAVKVFKQVQNTSWKVLWEKFRKEMEVLHLYQHPNILELCGCFSDGDRYVLVYPFLPNGSLHNKLHNQDAGKALSWQERLEVIKGTAKAVHHLHSTQPCAVVCANISSVNILLDECLQPKLTDFGMARLRPHSVNHSCTITMKTSIPGNLGYLPEEYIRDRKLSVKLDVYSFGMVVLEILTGKQVMQDKPKHRPLVSNASDVELPTYKKEEVFPVITSLRDVLDDMTEEGGGVDACLRLLDSRAGQWPHAVALSLFRLGMDCSSSKARNRPTMDMVLQTLSQLLPLPCPPDDQPHTLDDGMVLPKHSSPPAPTHSPSLPVEDDDETSSLPQGVLECAPPNTASSLQDSAALSAQSHPCEYSQSEVTFLGCMDRNGGGRQQQQQQPPPEGRDRYETANASASASACLSAHTLQSDGGGEPELDLYGSWPVQCSCTPDTDVQECEDCRANGFTPLPSYLSQGVVSGPSESYVENPAKQRLCNKIQQYNHGLLCTDELLSITP